MKNKIIIATIALFVMGATIVQAQESDSTFVRQLQMEREFNPSLAKDVTKIETKPTLSPHNLAKTNAQFSWLGSNFSPTPTLGKPIVENLMTDIEHRKEKAYASVLFGNYKNGDATVGISLLNSDNHILTATYQHNSFNGNINYLQKEYEPQKAFARYFDNNAKIRYRYMTDKNMFGIESSFFHSRYNNYGNGMNKYDNEKAQNQQFRNINTLISFGSLYPEWTDYSGSLEVNFFGAKHKGLTKIDNTSGSNLRAYFDINRPITRSRYKMGITTNAFAQFYDKQTNKDNFYNYVGTSVILGATPYISTEGYNWNLKAGAKVEFSNEGRINVSPVVAFKMDFSKIASLYLNADGGIKDNSMLNSFEECRFINPLFRLNNAYNLYSLKGGVIIGAGSSITLDAWATNGLTNDYHFLLPSTEYGATFLRPIYGDMFKSTINTAIRSNIIPNVELSLTATKNLYSVTIREKNRKTLTLPSETKAWNLPGMEITLGAEYKLGHSLVLMADYYLALDRWSMVGDKNVKMNNINSLNASAIYNINKYISLNLFAKNLLMSKHDIWYGIPNEGLNISAGLSVRF